MDARYSHCELRFINVYLHAHQCVHVILHAVVGVEMFRYSCQM